LGDALVDVLLPEGPGDDDAAVLLARAMPLDDPLVARFPAEVQSIPLMRRLLGRWLDEVGATRADADDLALASAEAAANAIEHAYGLAPGVVEMRAWTFRESVVKVAIRDFGNWRAPRGMHRGRGLQLMEGLTDEVEVVRSDEGTTIELSRQLGADAA
jgi:anti-sigma regulatory factor (Ser/Thr protein kinase)